MQIITIRLVSNNFTYRGPLISEDENLICIKDSKTLLEMSFPKTAVIIIRGEL